MTYSSVQVPRILAGRTRRSTNMNKASKDNANNLPDPNQTVDPAELNAGDLELLNEGVLQQVAGGGIYMNSANLRRG